MPYYVKRKKIKRKRFTKSALKLYLWLTILCFLVAAGFSFLTGKVPTLVREKMDDALIAEAEKTLGRKLKTSDLDLIEKTLGVKINPASLGGGRGWPKGAYGKGKFDDDFLNQIKKAYKGKISPADIKKARKAYKSGKADPADIERVKQAYKGGMVDQSGVKKGKKAYNR
ncbi:MAG: hypothetical protein JRF52_04770 [Deltaproteobacteria bacterium]|nr:hypothetical protein [Deltaproteobacteria bacterium]